MNKEQMIEALKKAESIAITREKYCSAYQSKRKQLQEFRKEAENFFTMERILHAARPVMAILTIIVFVIVFGKDKGLYEGGNTYTVICMGISAIGIVFVVKRILSAKKAYFKSKEYADKQAEIKNREQALEELAEKIRETNRQSLAAFGLLKLPYHTSFTLGKFIQYFESGRVDTLKEALAVYEEDCHRMKMEESQEQLLQEVQNLQNEVARLEQMTNQAYYK